MVHVLLLLMIMQIQLLAQTLKEESVYVGSGYCNTAYMNQTTTQSTEGTMMADILE
jgi:hypothetical protein